MLTIKAEIKRSELKVDGTYNVKIRFTLDRKVKRLSTNLFVTQQDLTKSLKFKEDTSIKREIDRLVLYYREQCLKLQLDQNHYSFLTLTMRHPFHKSGINEGKSMIFTLI